VVVVGAGFIGTEVARRLVGDGVDTTVLHRSPLAAGRAAMFVDSRCIQGSAADRDVCAPSMTPPAMALHSKLSSAA